MASSHFIQGCPTDYHPREDKSSSPSQGSTSEAWKFIKMPFGLGQWLVILPSFRYEHHTQCGRLLHLAKAASASHPKSRWTEFILLGIGIIHLQLLIGKNFDFIKVSPSISFYSNYSNGNLIHRYERGNRKGCASLQFGKGSSRTSVDIAKADSIVGCKSL